MFTIIYNLILFGVSAVTIGMILKDKKASWYTVGWPILLGTSAGNILVKVLELTYFS